MLIPLIDNSKLIVCRPALPFDTPGMLELTSRIWEGEDYVPDVWDDWMADPEGLLAVAESGGKVVGFGKLTRLSDSDWWLEGLRVHPEFEGRGIASHLNDYLLDYWQRIGSGVVRLATSSSREQVKHLSRKKGFQIIGEYTTFKALLTDKPTSGSVESLFHSLNRKKVGEALDWLTESGKERLPFGLMDLGWQFAEPIMEYIDRFLQTNQIWWWKDKQGILVMVEKKDGGDRWARIRMLASDVKELDLFLSDVLLFAGDNGYAGVTWLAPLIPQVVKKLSEAGFERDWDASLLIFEKSHN